MNDLRYCKSRFEKRQLINRLSVENERLKAQLRAQKRSAKESPFGSGTPSAKLPFKPDALSHRQQRRGGGKNGHAGHGRRRLHGSKEWRRVAAGALAHYGPVAQPAIAALRNALLDPDYNVRGYAAMALGAIGSAAIVALQDLRGARQSEGNDALRQLYNVYSQS